MAICIARGKGGTGNAMKRRRFKVTMSTTPPESQIEKGLAKAHVD